VSGFASSHEVHFRKRTAPVFANLLAAGAVILAGHWTGRRRWALLVAAIPLGLALVDFVWSYLRPLLTVTPWSLTYRPGPLQGAREISQAEIRRWSLVKKQLTLEFAAQPPLNIGLGNLSEDGRRELARLLQTFGYRGSVGAPAESAGLDTQQDAHTSQKGEALNG